MKTYCSGVPAVQNQPIKDDDLLLINAKVIKMKSKEKCGAHARSTGNPCNAKALPNGRCKLHGGLASGQRTQEGRQAISVATKARMSKDQLQKAKDGFQIWLKTGGREHMSKLAKRRFARAKLIKSLT